LAVGVSLRAVTLDAQRRHVRDRVLAAATERLNMIGVQRAAREVLHAAHLACVPVPHQRLPSQRPSSATAATLRGASATLRDRMLLAS